MLSIDEILGNELVCKTFSSKKEAQKDFATTVKDRQPSRLAQQHQKAAQRRFENDSGQFLQKIPAIRSTDKRPDLSRILYINNQKRQAVRNFLPYLEAKISYLKGRAKHSTTNCVLLLKIQKTKLLITEPGPYEIAAPTFNSAKPPMKILIKKPDQHGQCHASARETVPRRPLDSAHRRKKESFESKLDNFEKSDDDSTSDTDSINSWND